MQLTLLRKKKLLLVLQDGASRLRGGCFLRPSPKQAPSLPQRSFHVECSSIHKLLLPRLKSTNPFVLSFLCVCAMRMAISLFINSVTIYPFIIYLKPRAAKSLEGLYKLLIIQSRNLSCQLTSRAGFLFELALYYGKLHCNLYVRLLLLVATKLPKLVIVKLRTTKTYDSRMGP